MAADPTRLDKVLKRFRAKKVMTLPELTVQLDCSPRTVHRRLNTWRVINSYNHNGRYYTLPEVPEFDAHGLWRYRDIGFSQHGNLTETVVQLVKHSPAGLSGAELGGRLGLDPRPFLSFFRDHPALKREAHRGRFVYFSAESSICRRQQSRRSTMPARIEAPTDAEAIAILVQTIKHPDWSIEQLCGQLKRQGVKVSAEAVSSLFADHGLQIKKRHVLLRNLSFPLPEPAGSRAVL